MRRALFCLSTVVLCQCNPTVKVEAPDEPIRIDLNVNIEHHIRVEIDRDLDELIQEEKELFE